MMRLRVSAVILCATAFAACGSVSDSVDFHAPPNFVSKASLGPLMQIWQSNDSRSVLIVMKIPGEIDIDKAMNSADIKSAKPISRKNITICNGQRAVLSEMVGTTGGNVKLGIGAGESSSENSKIDFMLTHAGGDSYMAMYAWPIHNPPDRAAQAALRGLCAKK
ncbi:MAG: hypothetical protein M3R51_08935 [Candidatus Eremiobacteraeota bacterium]|nr:hypothetical protein [Candidatus Eremiobacteraeota bacterium]